MDRTVNIRDIIIHGDVYTGLSLLPNSSIRVAITSPPYWKQRDYGFPEQIGQEKTPEEYIGRLVAIFNQLREKLTSDGVFFLNIGDKYLHRYGKSHLLQIPYRLAYHMIKNGWILQDILIWYKPNHMPSSVKDRFTNTYEPIFVFAKSEKNIYIKPESYEVLKIPLQQTRWKHTAVYPEKLVKHLLQLVELQDDDIVLDPFAGTETTPAVARQIRQNIWGRRPHFTLIEKGEEFIEIIQQRIGRYQIVKVEDLAYSWEPVKEQPLTSDVGKKVINTNKFGEVIITNNQLEFLQVLQGMASEEFKRFHREDALFFVGTTEPHINALYQVHFMLNHGYVLRNMLVVQEKNLPKWFPIFMFARDSTKVAYRFDIDKIREQPKTVEENEWKNKSFVGLPIRDVISKEPNDGTIVEVLNKYSDGFPKIVAVELSQFEKIEFLPVLHPNKDDLLREGLRFFCPHCNTQLTEPYDPIGINKCPTCYVELWTSIQTVPIIQEPKELRALTKELKQLKEQKQYIVTKNNGYSLRLQSKPKSNNSKFANLSRINWGASPGARKQMLGTYFTKLRLYKIDQPAVAQYLTLLRKEKGLTIKQIFDYFPESYKHTVGHWFRKDFGGSIPLPEDLEKLKNILGDPINLLSILQKTTLKYQTVKAYVKGKNPGDFLITNHIEELRERLYKTFTPICTKQT